MRSGEASYKKMLLYSEGITLSPEKVLEIGLAELKKQQAVFNAAAKTINPNKKPIDVLPRPCKKTTRQLKT